MTVNVQDSVWMRSEANTRLFHGAEGLLQKGVTAWTNQNETMNNDTVTNLYFKQTTMIFTM